MAKIPFFAQISSVILPKRCRFTVSDSTTMMFRFRILAVFLPLLFFACKHDSDIPQAVICRVVSLTDQLDVNGRLTDQMQRTFTYSNGQLTQLAERNTDRQVTLALEYGPTGAVTRASDGTTVLALGYTTPATHPTSATVTRNGAAQMTYELAYNAGSRLTRLLETRQVIPTNSLVRSREYTFAYDADGLLTTEKLTSTLTDRTTVEQETAFTYGTTIHPLGNFAHGGLLSLLAMSQSVESMPGRFWQTRAMQEYKTYNAKNGIRGTLRETALFTTKLDASGRLGTQEQNTVSTSGSGQASQRKNQHSFVYECQ